MSTFSLKESFEHIVYKTDEMVSEVNKALDNYEHVLEHGSASEKMLELGVLMANVRRGKEQAYDLLCSVPSPNQVPEHLGGEVAEVTRALFGFVQSCEQREKIIVRMAVSMEQRMVV